MPCEPRLSLSLCRLRFHRSIFRTYRIGVLDKREHAAIQV